MKYSDSLLFFFFYEWNKQYHMEMCFQKNNHIQNVPHKYYQQNVQSVKQHVSFLHLQ